MKRKRQFFFKDEEDEMFHWYWSVNRVYNNFCTMDNVDVMQLLDTYNAIVKNITFKLQLMVIKTFFLVIDGIKARLEVKSYANKIIRKLKVSFNQSSVHGTNFNST